MSEGRQLFDYQQKLVADGDALRAAGRRHLLNVAPTGAGKTDVMCAKIKRHLEAGLPCLVMCDTIEIAGQIVDRLKLYGIAAGRIQGGYPLYPYLMVQVATRQSLTTSFLDRNAHKLPPFKRLHIDEAHTAASLSFRKVFERYPEALRDGYSATPYRAGKLGLEAIFDELVMGPTVAHLQDIGRLVKTKMYAPQLDDLEGIRTRSGDYHEGDLEERLNKPKIVGDVVQHWLRIAEGRLSLVYGVTVAHCVAIRNAFRGEGIKAEVVSGQTLDEERAEVLAMLARGEVQVVVNCAVLTKGFDCPPVSCVQVARPTKSLVLWRQIVGRGLRSHPGKSDCVVIDHGGMTHMLGLPEDEIAWTLEPDKAPVNLSQAARKTDEHGKQFVECSQCSAMRRVGAACDVCGFYPPPKRPEDVETLDANLGLVDTKTRGVAPDGWEDIERRKLFYRELLGFVTGHNKKPGFAYHKYMERFPNAPKPPYSWRQLMPIEPSPETRRWLKSRAIAWAKRNGGGAYGVKIRDQPAQPVQPRGDFITDHADDQNYPGW